MEEEGEGRKEEGGGRDQKFAAAEFDKICKVWALRYSPFAPSQHVALE